MASIDGIAEPSGGWKQGAWIQGRQYWGGTLSAPGQINSLSDQPGAGGAAYVAPKDTAYIKQEQAKYATQNPQTKEQVAPMLDNFQNNLYNSAIAPETKVRTTEEVKAEILPKTTVTPLNRVEEFGKLLTTYGVADLEKSLTTIKDQVTAEQDLLRQQRGIEEGKPVPMGVISGRISEEERVANVRLDALGRQQSRLVDELNTKYNLVNTYMNYMGLDYQDAVNRADTEFKQNIAVYDIIAGERKEARSEFEYDQTAAKANLQIYMNAITSGNLSYGNMSTDQKLMISKLEVQSGLPVGFISNLKMNPKDKIFSVNEKTGEALTFDENGNFKVIQTGMKATGDGSAITANLNNLKTDIAAKMTLEQVMAKYSDSISPDTILSTYNSYSPWGTARESLSELQTKYNVSAGTITKLSSQDQANIKQIKDDISSSLYTREDAVQTYPEYAQYL